MSDVVKDNTVCETGDIEEITRNFPDVDAGNGDDGELVSTLNEDQPEKEVAAGGEHDEAAVAGNIKSDHEAKVEQKTESSPKEVNEASNDYRAVDAEGWEDLLGSGRLRKRVVVEGDPKNHPAKGFQVKIHFKGDLSVFQQIIKSNSVITKFQYTRVTISVLCHEARAQSSLSVH